MERFLRSVVDDYKALTLAFGSAKADYDKRRRQLQLDSHLSAQSLRGGCIAKLKSSDITSLSSYCINTAFDAKWRDVQQGAEHALPHMQQPHAIHPVRVLGRSRPGTRYPFDLKAWREGKCSLCIRGEKQGFSR